jgi:sarcosine oxidase, subunit delta
VSYLLTCPHCGVREVSDFAFGGEVNPRPTVKPTMRELGAYVHFRRNVAGLYHRSGCRAWFLAERDTRTNEVHSVFLPQDAPRDGPQGAAVAAVAAPQGAAPQTAAGGPATTPPAAGGVA